MVSWIASLWWLWLVLALSGNALEFVECVRTCITGELRSVYTFTLLSLASVCWIMFCISFINALV